MLCLTLQVKGRRIISPALVVPNDGEGLRMDRAKEYLALFDTGATRTNISTKLQKELSIERTAMRRVRTASGIVSSQECVFGIDLPMDGGKKILFEVEGSALKLPGDIDVLIGMDIITQGSFKIDFDGKVTFCVKS